MIASPLRYPGGKAKLFGFFSELIKQNNIFGHEYCEPYAGGAGLALKLLSTGFVERVRLNDIDPAIFSFWFAALRRTDELCKLIESTPITVSEWRNQRQLWKACDLSNPLELGFAAYFLNRTSRSGIIDGSGPIGGYEQAGLWKIDVRLIKEKQISNIRSIAKFSSQIEITNDDALYYVRNNIHGKKKIIYLDPPYYIKGKKLYKNFYVHSDHVNIAAELYNNRSAKWVVSYDDVEQIRDIYHLFNPTSYSLQYSAGKKGSGKEVIYLSDALTLPEIDGFRSAA